MKKLLVYLKNYKKECILGPLFKLLEALFELLVPLVVAAIVDKAIPTGDHKAVWLYCALLLGLGIVGLVSAITAQYFAAKAACGFTKNVKRDLFAHLQSLSFAEIEKLGTNTMITRLTADMDQLQTGVNMTLRLFLRSPFVVFGAMIMAFTVDAKAALVFVVTIPVLAAVIFAIIFATMPLYRRVRQGLDQILGHTRSNLNGVRVVRAFRLEQQEISEFTAANQRLTALQNKAGNLSALMNPLTYVLINVAIVVLVYVGAIRVQTGVITQGAVLALYNYMSQILIELVKLANYIITLTKGLACANRVAKVFEVKSAQKDGDYKENTAQNGLNQWQPAAEVVFNKVSFSYPNSGEESLTDISFTVGAGQTVGIIGATGSGKSTLVGLIMRQFDVSSGSVLVGGKNVTEYECNTLRRKIGFVPQNNVLFSGTLGDNMRWGDPNATDEEILKAIETAVATDIFEQKPNGLKTMVEQNGRNFSGGQRQRLTIARALLRKPAILILDDSSSALDYATDKKLRQNLAALPQKPTLFLVSQRTNTVQNADQIIVLDDGKMVGKGTHEQLLKDCTVYREIYLSQHPKGVQV